MSRRRYVTPEFWEEPVATRLSPGGRLTLIGLWTRADDHGRLLWDPALVKDLIYPADAEVSVEAISGWLSEVEALDLVVVYGGPQGRSYGALRDFAAQHPTRSPLPSRLPAPPVAADGQRPVRSGAERGASIEMHPRFREAGTRAFMEAAQPRLITHSVSETEPEPTRVVSEGVRKSALTCGNADSSRTHDGLTESVGSTHDELITDSREERKGKEGKGRERLSASRSVRARDFAIEPDTATPSATCACGAANDHDAHSAVIDLASTAGQAPATTAGDTPPSATPTSLPSSPDTTVTEPLLAAPDLSGSGASLEGETATGPGSVQAEVTPMAQPVDEGQESLFAVDPDMVVETKPKKTKKAQPSTWTPERKELAHSILHPWWSRYGDGWAQSRGVVFGVIVAALANGVTVADITSAMEVLGKERRTISGGTIQFALARTMQSQRALEAQRAMSSPSKYQRRTM